MSSNRCVRSCRRQRRSSADRFLHFIVFFAAILRNPCSSYPLKTHSCNLERDLSLHGKWNRRYNIQSRQPQWETGDYATFERVPADESGEIPDNYDGMGSLNDSITSDEMSLSEIERAIGILEQVVQPARIERLKKVISMRSGNICAVFENPSNPNNVWAALRTIDSFGIQNVHVIADPKLYVKKGRLLTMRSAMGSQKWLTLHGYDSATDCSSLLKANGFRLLGSSLDPQSKSLEDIDWSDEQPTAICFGNEMRGLSDAMLSHCDATFYIPMRGFAESFNVSVALSIVLSYAMLKNKRSARGLGEFEVKGVYLKWLLNSTSAGYEILCRENVHLPRSFGERFNVKGIAGFNPTKT